MKIFTTVDVIGQGLPLIMPNGVIMMQELQRWIEDEETKRGYVRTKTPLMAKSDLYKISGHWIITKMVCLYLVMRRRTKRFTHFVR